MFLAFGERPHALRVKEIPQTLRAVQRGNHSSKDSQEGLEVSSLPTFSEHPYLSSVTLRATAGLCQNLAGGHTQVQEDRKASSEGSDIA